MHELESGKRVYRGRARDRWALALQVVIVLAIAGFYFGRALNLIKEKWPWTGSSGSDGVIASTSMAMGMFLLLVAGLGFIRISHFHVAIEEHGFTVPRRSLLPWLRHEFRFDEIVRWGYGPVGYRLNYPGQGFLIECQGRKPQLFLPFQFEEPEELAEDLIARLPIAPSEVQPRLWGRLRFA